MDENDIVCNDCDLRYQVIFNNDWARSNGIDLPWTYCPGCGSDVLTLPERKEPKNRKPKQTAKP